MIYSHIFPKVVIKYRSFYNMNAYFFKWNFSNCFAIKELNLFFFASSVPFVASLIESITTGSIFHWVLLMLKHQINHKLQIQQNFHISRVETFLLIQHLWEFHARFEAQNHKIIDRKLVCGNKYDILSLTHDDFIIPAYWREIILRC